MGFIVLCFSSIMVVLVVEESVTPLMGAAEDGGKFPDT